VSNAINWRLKPGSEVAARLVNLVAVLCILSWRIFWMTMINRSEPGATPDVGFTELELYYSTR
jgi:hypothetical protein